jgi:hypothetical protein
MHFTEIDLKNERQAYSIEVAPEDSSGAKIRRNIPQGSKDYLTVALSGNG